MAGMAVNPAPTKGKRGRKPILDPELVAAALAELKGNVVATAERFNVARSSVQGLISNRPALQRVLADAREGMKDKAESALYAAALRGEAWAVCFFLKTQAKDRGYVERQETANVGNESVRVLFVEEIVERVRPAARNPDSLAPGPAAVLPIEGPV